MKYFSLLFLSLLLVGCNDKETLIYLESLPVEHVEHDRMPLTVNKHIIVADSFDFTAIFALSTEFNTLTALTATQNVIIDNSSGDPRLKFLNKGVYRIEGYTDLQITTVSQLNTGNRTFGLNILDNNTVTLVRLITPAYINASDAGAPDPAVFFPAQTGINFISVTEDNYILHALALNDAAPTILGVQGNISISLMQNSE